MTINKLNDYAMKICLDKNDMDRFNINFAYIDADCIKNLILIMSDEISELLGINISNEKLYVEVFSQKNGCLIFISCSSKNSVKRHIRKNIICQFENFESLKDLCDYISINFPFSIRFSKLYCNNHHIRLILGIKNDYDNIIKISSEYSSIISGNEINAGATKEYFQCVYDDKAVEKVSLYAG